MKMRELFSGYYSPTENELKYIWKECIFAFDANILLNIYRYTPKARERFLDILRNLRERIWIPYQVAFEYQKERNNVISQRLKGHEKLLSEKSDCFSKLKKILDNQHTFLDDEAKNEIKIVLEQAERKIKNVIDDDKLKNSSVNFDKIRDCLDEILGDNVGEKYSLDDLQKKYKKAQERFDKKIPPGYEDNKKQEPEKYGDFIIWQQLIDYANSQKKPLIFVTDDKKGDWWSILDGEIKGVRPELVQEIKNETGVAFYMYTNYKFMEYAERFLDLPHEQEVIDEARNINLEEEAQEKIEIAKNIEYISDVKQLEQISALTDKILLRNIDLDALKKYLRQDLTTRNINLDTLNKDIRQDLIRRKIELDIINKAIGLV
ncbi:PIN domain-containing protein [Calothrix sp. 336/3]|uniref:PIN domain-containing protein n=1 Tax=Calothrix sp. 336/3 TaxID=1337936 RepID=UPI00069B78EC|nr:PIN domain-containing protein [Calothrix sp. 336/3]